MKYKVIATHNIQNGTALVLANSFGKITSGDKLEVDGDQFTIANISFVPSFNSHQGVFIQATLNIKVSDIVTVTR